MEWMCSKFCSTMSVVVHNGRNVYVAATQFIPSSHFLSYSFIHCFDMDIKNIQAVQPSLTTALSLLQNFKHFPFNTYSLELFVIACCYVLLALPCYSTLILPIHVSIIKFHRTLLLLYSYQNYTQCVHHLQLLTAIHLQNILEYEKIMLETFSLLFRYR